ncbi:hypothetical protein LCGC14_2303720, partial [marine sediment metagenome]
MVDWFCTTTGASGHTGVDEANAFDLAEAISEINSGALGWVDGDRMNLKDNAGFSTTGINITNLGALTTYSQLEGYTDSPGDGGKATIQLSSGVNHLLIIPRYWTAKNFILDGNSNGGNCLQTHSRNIIWNIEAKNASARGSGGGGVFINCYLHNNGTYGGHA